MPVQSIATRLWPELETLSGQPRAAGVANVAGALASLPLGAAGVAWLGAATDPGLIRREWLVLLLLLALYLLAERLNFFVFVQVRAGEYSDFSSSLSNVILWSGVLILGPSVLWLAVLVLTAEAARDWPRQATPDRWARARNYGLNLVEITLAPLVALVAYRLWGGAIPLPGLSLAAVLPALAATAVQYGLGKAAWLAYILYRGRIDVPGATWSPSQSSIKFAALAFGLPALAEPFAILAAGLYVRDGPPVFLFFVAGLLLASALAQRLSRAAERSEQRSGEMEKLEQLGRALIDAPPDASTLPAVLAAHVPGMFSHAGIEIRAAPAGTLLHEPAHWPPVAEPAWDWLCSQASARTFLPGDEQPWDGRPAREALVVAPVLDVETGRTIGGIYVVLNPALQRLDVGSAARLVPAVRSLAAQVASALHRADVYAETLAHQRVVRELELAGQIQASFLPADLPAVPGWQIAATLRPARQTSGDFYDVIELPGGRLGLVVADVADKGMGAALYMALARTLIRTYAVEFQGAPDRVLAAANRRILADTRADQFVTVFYGILDPATGRLAYCNAGHPPAYVLSHRSRQVTAVLGTSGIPLGIDAETGWEQGEVELAAGDVLLLYTDGVTEAQDAREALWGADRLVEAAAARLDLPAAEMLAGLVAEVEAFAGTTAQYDDITLLVIKHEPARAH